MQFFKILFLSLFVMSEAKASDLKQIIISKEYGSCETNNLYFSAMKFYKIPLNQKYENYDLYLRVLLFFNLDNTLSLRLNTQALLGCQTTTAGEEACSYLPVENTWIKTHFIQTEIISVDELGSIELINPTNTNRGFELTFKETYHRPHLRGQKFIGGMVAVNFNQHGTNTINICKEGFFND